MRQEAGVGGAGLVTALPQRRAVVAVKEDLYALGGAGGKAVGEALAVGGRQDGEADAAQIDGVKVFEGGVKLQPAGVLQQVACRRLVAPVEEGALARSVELDEVETGLARRVGQDVAGVDAVGLPARFHATAERVVAERGEVVDANGIGRGDAGEVGGGVEAVAAIGLAHGTERLAVQLNHTFADKCEGFHGIRVVLSK